MPGNPWPQPNCAHARQAFFSGGGGGGGETRQGKGTLGKCLDLTLDGALHTIQDHVELLLVPHFGKRGPEDPVPLVSTMLKKCTRYWYQRAKTVDACRRQV